MMDGKLVCASRSNPGRRSGVAVSLDYAKIITKRATMRWRPVIRFYSTSPQHPVIIIRIWSCLV
jgi:hypothetical protein